VNGPVFALTVARVRRELYVRVTALPHAAEPPP
jgi:hypothetical protein